MKKVVSKYWLATMVVLAGVIPVAAQPIQPKKSHELWLFETKVIVNEYEVVINSRPSPVTFVSLHHDEQTSLGLVKEIIKDRGGKLLEIVSRRPGREELISPYNGQVSRYLYFSRGGKHLCIDPNRIFSDLSTKGIAQTLQSTGDELCENSRSPEAQTIVRSIETVKEIKKFSDGLLALMFPEKNCPPSNIKRSQLCKNEYLVAVHNNSDFEVNPKGINAQSFFKLRPYISEENPRRIRLGEENKGLEYDDTEAAYVVNRTDLDEFFIVSREVLLQKLLGSCSSDPKFTIGVQKPNPSDEHGYLSVLAAQRKTNYIIIEAEDDTGKARQDLMIRKVIDTFDRRKVPCV